MVLAGTAVVAAVTQNDLVGLRGDIQRLGGQIGQLVKDIGDMKNWQAGFTETQKFNEHRFREITDDQAEFVRQCRANHVRMAPPLPIALADDDKVSKSQLAIGVVLIVSFLTYVGHGAIAFWNWARSVKP